MKRRLRKFYDKKKADYGRVYEDRLFVKRSSFVRKLRERVMKLFVGRQHYCTVIVTLTSADSIKYNFTSIFFIYFSLVPKS